MERVQLQLSLNTKVCGLLEFALQSKKLLLAAHGQEKRHKAEACQEHLAA